MKKNILLISCLMMALFLTACAKNSKDPEQTQPSQAAQEQSPSSEESSKAKSGTQPQQKSEIDTNKAWLVHGTMTPEFANGQNQEFWGFDFNLKYNGQTKKFEPTDQMGDIDKIEFYEITQSSIKVAISRKYTLRETKPDPVGGSVTINDTDTSAIVQKSEDKNYYYVTSQFNREYHLDEVKKISFSYGKVD